MGVYVKIASGLGSTWVFAELCERKKGRRRERKGKGGQTRRNDDAAFFESSERGLSSGLLVMGSADARKWIEGDWGISYLVLM